MKPSQNREELSLPVEAHSGEHSSRGGVVTVFHCLPLGSGLWRRDESNTSQAHDSAIADA